MSATNNYNTIANSNPSLYNSSNEINRIRSNSISSMMLYSTLTRNGALNFQNYVHSSQQQYSKTIYLTDGKNVIGNPTPNIVVKNRRSSGFIDRQDVFSKSMVYFRYICHIFFKFISCMCTLYFSSLKIFF